MLLRLHLAIAVDLLGGKMRSDREIARLDAAGGDDRVGQAEQSAEFAEAAFGFRFRHFVVLHHVMGEAFVPREEFAQPAQIDVQHLAGRRPAIGQHARDAFAARQGIGRRDRGDLGHGALRRADQQSVGRHRVRRLDVAEFLDAEQRRQRDAVHAFGAQFRPAPADDRGYRARSTWRVRRATIDRPYRSRYSPIRAAIVVRVSTPKASSIGNLSAALSGAPTTNAPQSGPSRSSNCMITSAAPVAAREGSSTLSPAASSPQTNRARRPH